MDNIIFLLWITLGSIGLALIIAGLAIDIAQKSKVKKCTGSVTGHVIRHSFPGEGRMFPVVEYQAGGKTYTVKRKFRGIVTKKKIAPGKIHEDKGAFVSEEDVLHVPMSAVTNLRAMAEELWPVGSEMLVYYNPAKPKQAYAEKLPEHRPVEVTVFVATGLGIILFTVVITVINLV